MFELMILAGLVLWGAIAFIDAGSGHRRAGRLGTRISVIVAHYSATVDELNYAARRQTELLLELDPTSELAAEK